MVTPYALPGPGRFSVLGLAKNGTEAQVSDASEVFQVLGSVPSTATQGGSR